MSKTAADISMNAPNSPALSLRLACRKTGYDDSGRRCPGCPLRELCDSEERWIVRLADRSRMT
jgi:hypothetical protein